MDLPKLGPLVLTSVFIFGSVNVFICASYESMMAKIHETSFILARRTTDLATRSTGQEDNWPHV